MRKLLGTRDFYLTDVMVDNILPCTDISAYKIQLEFIAKSQIDFEFTLEITFLSKSGNPIKAYYDFFPPIKTKLMLVGLPERIEKDEIFLMMIKWHDDKENIKKNQPLIFDLNLYEIDLEERSKS